MEKQTYIEGWESLKENDIDLKLMRMGFETITEKSKITPEVTPDELMTNVFDIVSQLNMMSNKFYSGYDKSNKENEFNKESNSEKVSCANQWNKIVIPTDEDDVHTFFIGGSPYFVEENKILLQSQKTNGNEAVLMTEEEMRSFYDIFDYLSSSQLQTTKEMMNEFKKNSNEN
ncbi:hypothetical protein ENUP19_0057G0047 [Entamoeba nuttalli]|uniref:Uncharacterized protein n=1 Tax=Entamoeba nuttalli TaxID=412467 RepID=A0ABQ0DCY0_9EUKA